jgi:hypothetical protein
LFFLLLLARHLNFEYDSASSFQNRLLCVAIISFFLSTPFALPSFLKGCSPSNYQNGDLHQSLATLEERKALVFLRHPVNQEFISWNDPFLKEGPILCRDLGAKNAQAIAAFPQHKPMYFGLLFERHNNQLSPEFGISDHAQTATNLPYSLMRLGLFLLTSQSDRSKDIFDIEYSLGSSPDTVEQQLAYLEAQEKSELLKRQTYSRDFKLGLIHTAKLLLNPRHAYYQRGNHDWQNSNLVHFRSSLTNAIHFLEASGEVGKPVIGAVMRIYRRVDQDDNHYLSDSEISEFLKRKIEVLQSIEGLVPPQQLP